MKSIGHDGSLHPRKELCIHIRGVDRLDEKASKPLIPRIEGFPSFFVLSGFLLLAPRRAPVAFGLTTHSIVTDSFVGTLHIEVFRFLYTMTR